MSFLPRCILRSWRGLTDCLSARKSRGPELSSAGSFHSSSCRRYRQLPAKQSGGCAHRARASRNHCPARSAAARQPTRSSTRWCRMPLMPRCCASSAARSTGDLPRCCEADASGEAAEPQLIAWHFAEANVPDKSVRSLSKGRRARDRPVRAGRDGSPSSQWPASDHARSGFSRSGERRELALQLRTRARADRS